MGTLRQDLLYGLRTLVRNPVFTVAAVLTLALGIGVNTAMFSIVDGVLMRPLPYADSSRLVLIRVSIDGGKSLPSVSPPEIEDFRQRTSVFENVASIRDASASLTGTGDPVQIQMANVTWNFFSTLGVTPVLGRDFAAGDDAANAAPTVLISHGLWQRRFGGDPNLVGRSIELDGRANTVLGILPPGLQLLLPRETGLPKNLDAYQPFNFDFSTVPRFRWMRGLARLRDGVSLAQARSAMDTLARQLAGEHAQYAQQPFAYSLVPLQEDLVQPVRKPLLLLFGAVGFVVLIACGNVASLLLARAADRERELGLRLALGAGRARLVRQMLTEGLLLALAGCAGGLLLAAAGMRLVDRLAPENLPRFDTLALDSRAVLFAVGTSLLTVALFALAPALLASQTIGVFDGLKSGGRSAGGRERARLRRLLVVAEIALSLVLLVGAGLMIRAFVDLHRVEPGFEPKDLHTFQVSLPFQRYSTPEATFDFYRRLSERLESDTGIDRVGGIFPLPMSGRFWTNDYAYDSATSQNWGAVESDNHVVLPGTLESMGARLVAGRLFTWTDNAEARKVVIVDVRLAAKAWPGESAVGKELEVLLTNDVHEKLLVVGVVEHIRQEHPASDGREQTYLLPVHWPFWAMPMTVRSPLPESDVRALVRAELRELDPQLAAFQMRTMESYVQEVLAGHRFVTVLLGLFAVLAVVLAAVGLYGTMAYAVAQRRRELGIRIALGASARGIVGLVVVQGLSLVATGAGIGLAGSLLVSRLLASFLYGASPFHAPTYALLILALALVGCVASWLPARRAAGAPPAAVLNLE